MKEAYKKLRNGESLTDEEIDTLLQGINNAMPWLEALPEFGLCWKQATFDNMALEDMKRSRRL